MASLCTRCALRLRRAATAEPFSLLRPLSTTTSRPKHAIPIFAETSNAELNDVLASMRDKHFIPAALKPSHRKLIFGHSNRQELASNPRAVEIAGERIELKWIDQLTEIPNRTKLFRRAVKLMAEDRSGEAWKNLIQLLTGLKRSGVTVQRMEMERLMRLATESGNFDAVIQCLRRADETAMTLQRPEVLEAVLLGLRKEGQADGWSEESMEKAMRRGRDIAQLLETEMHSGGKQLKDLELRRDPRVIGVFLELSAVFVEKHQGGVDVDGRVKAYSERLLYNIDGAKEVRSTQSSSSVCPTDHRAQIQSTEPPKEGPQTEVLLTLPIWHGLKLAHKILAIDMPNPMLAEEVRSNYEDGLTTLVRKLEARDPNPTPGGYVDQALTAWRDCWNE